MKHISKLARVLLFVGSSAGLEAQSMLRPSVIKTLFPTEDLVIASLVIDAPDRDSDATSLIQSGIDKVAEEGGGVVFLRAGQFRIEGHLVLREGVTLRGDWCSPDRPESSQGTLLTPLADRGNSEGPACITLERGSGIREITLWYPEQDPGHITPYPWTLKGSASRSGDNITLLNVTLLNPYQAICIGPEWNELHTVRNVYGTPLKTGISMDSTTDIGRLHEVDFGPQWWEGSSMPNAPKGEQSVALRKFLMDAATGVDMGRSDWEFMDGVKIQGYHVGCAIRAGAKGSANGVMFNCEFTGCEIGLRLDDMNEVGLSATGCSFSGSASAIQAPASFKSVAQFNTCRMEGGSPQVHLLGPGVLSFQNCVFTDWQDQALRAEAGILSVMGCEFKGSGTHIGLENHVMAGRILGNQFHGDPRIDNKSLGDVFVCHEDLDFKRPNLSVPPEPAGPRPSSDRLFVVTDFGAGQDLEDNTPSFQSALQAAQEAGGGTVYVPAGYFKFQGHLSVPCGVELRGCFDVPHHTQSGGSVLMPMADRGQDSGTPFVTLNASSGLRGLTFWYPEQNLMEVLPYPWTLQSLGPKCWLVDVTLGNSYQAADFASHPSDGHIIRYLAGAPLRRGLRVGQSREGGWVEDVQFNPHYSLRLHAGMPHPPYSQDPGEKVIAYQREHLEGIVFGHVEGEIIRRTFLYAAFDGIAFKDDLGKSTARVLIHGTDTGSRGVVLEGAKEVEFINAQLVPLSQWEQGAIIVTPSFKGRARFFNNQMWAGKISAVIEGEGHVLIQQLNTLTGPLKVRSGHTILENLRFSKGFRPQVVVEDDSHCSILGCTGQKKVEIENHAGKKCRSLGL